MQDIFQKTRELGQALMESEEFKNMKAAEDKAMKNQEAAQTMARYIELRSSVADLLSSANPDPEAMRRISDEMDETQEKLQMIDDIVALNEARGQFNNLIAQVNQVLQFIVTGHMDDGDTACTGSCATCHGCSH